MCKNSSVFSVLFRKMLRVSLSTAFRRYLPAIKNRAHHPKECGKIRETKRIWMKRLDVNSENGVGWRMEVYNKEVKAVSLLLLSKTLHRRAQFQSSESTCLWTYFFLIFSCFGSHWKIQPTSPKIISMDNFSKECRLNATSTCTILCFCWVKGPLLLVLMY